VNADFTATLVELIDALAKSDPRCARFGAATHRWQRRPALAEARVAELERAAGVRLPDDYRAYVTTVGDGGAGPYHGVLPLDHPAQHALLSGTCPLPDGTRHPWHGVVALADLGCDQAALLVVTGPARGTVWADARVAAAGLVPLAPSFTDFLGGGLAAAARGELPPAVAPADRCILPRLLSALFAREEERLGRAAGTLAGAELRGVLAGLDPVSVAIASTGGTPLHDLGDPIAPCVACAILIANLADQGLVPDVLALPRPPRLVRPVE
jgi:hypothetical protein